MPTHLRKLGRSSSHRWALLRNMVNSLVMHGRICTTVEKAKELRRLADKVVTLGKKGTLTSTRQCTSGECVAVRRRVANSLTHSRASSDCHPAHERRAPQAHQRDRSLVQRPCWYVCRAVPYRTLHSPIHHCSLTRDECDRRLHTHPARHATTQGRQRRDGVH